jgi:hypothetical protein
MSIGGNVQLFRWFSVCDRSSDRPLCARTVGMEAASYFAIQARECRKLARHSDQLVDRGALLSLARHYDREVARAATEAAARREQRH